MRRRRATVLMIVGVLHAATALLRSGARANGNDSFEPINPMGTPRRAHTATALPDGTVLIAGGENASLVRGGRSLDSAELYDPDKDRFLQWSGLRMTSPRSGHTATLLRNGKVLLAGGWSSTLLASAEIYDPAASKFAPTGSMSAARHAHTATLLPDGKVLIAGGSNSSGAALRTAEIYDPSTGAFAPTGGLVTARERHLAIPLAHGQVLIVGVAAGRGQGLAAAEVYDPPSGKFSETGSLTANGAGAAARLKDGKVLVVGLPGSAANLYDAVSGKFSAVTCRADGAAAGPVTTACLRLGTFVSATLLESGKVLIAHGFPYSAEVYDPVTNAFGIVGNMTVDRADYTATLVKTGHVLVLGGADKAGRVLATAELFGPAL
jgi:hypothetical protein